MFEPGSSATGRLDVPYEHLIDNPFDVDDVERAKRQFYLEVPSTEAIEERQREIDKTQAALEVAERNLQVAAEAARQAIREAEAAESLYSSLVNRLESLQHSPVVVD